MTESNSNTIYRYEFTVPESAVDQNGHVNNVVYVQWMQDVAILHANATGGTRAMHAAGGTWVVHSHKVEYLSPAFADEEESDP
jgi:acyl-CoA thioester hydrolase